MQTDLLGDVDFATMVNFFRRFLPSVHKPSTIDDIAHAVEVMYSKPVSATPSVKDRCRLRFDVIDSFFPVLGELGVWVSNE